MKDFVFEFILKKIEALKATNQCPPCLRMMSVLDECSDQLHTTNEVIDKCLGELQSEQKIVKRIGIAGMLIFLYEDFQ